MQTTCPNCGHTWFRHPDSAEPRGLDPKVADILRDEARHEANERQVEAAVALSARRRTSPLRWIDGDRSEANASVAEHTAAEPRHASMAAVWVGATLRPSASRKNAGGREGEEGARRLGFRLGFLPIILLSAAGIAAYLYAPQIVDALPKAEPYMSSYVEWMSSLRLYIGSGIDYSFERIQSIISSFQ